MCKIKILLLLIYKTVCDVFSYSITHLNISGVIVFYKAFYNNVYKVITAKVITAKVITAKVLPFHE